MSILKKLKPDVYCIGSEFVTTHIEEMDFVESYGGRIKIIPEFDGVIHTSEIKKRLLDEEKRGI